MDSRLRKLADYFLARKTVTEIDPRTIGKSLLRHVYILDVDRRPAAPQFRIHLTGTAIDHRFGRSVRGHLVEDFVHGPHHGEIIKAYIHCANTREAVWMRHSVRMTDKRARFVEGVAFYFDPDRIYGGLVTGDLEDLKAPTKFEIEVLSRPAQP